MSRRGRGSLRGGRRNGKCAERQRFIDAIREMLGFDPLYYSGYVEQRSDEVRFYSPEYTWEED